MPDKLGNIGHMFGCHHQSQANIVLLIPTFVCCVIIRIIPILRLEAAAAAAYSSHLCLGIGATVWKPAWQGPAPHSGPPGQPHQQGQVAVWAPASTSKGYASHTGATRANPPSGLEGCIGCWLPLPHQGPREPKPNLLGVCVFC